MQPTRLTTRIATTITEINIIKISNYSTDSVMSDPTIATSALATTSAVATTVSDSYGRTVAFSVGGGCSRSNSTSSHGSVNSIAVCNNRSADGGVCAANTGGGTGDVGKIDLISTIDGTMAPIAVKTITTFQTPTIAVTETTDTIVAKRGRKAAKVDFVRFDSSETIFATNTDHEDSVIRAKIKDEIKR